MSPKKTPRGGKYTTGIKRTSTGGYGGQTTGRRGWCMVLVVGLFALLGLPVVAIGGFVFGLVAR